MNSTEPKEGKKSVTDQLKSVLFVAITFIIIGVLIYFEMK